jgi:hypothetical protein
MYSICKVTHPATGVEHALTCHFFNRTEKSLIVAGANIIRVFRLIPDVDPANKKDVYTGIDGFIRDLGFTNQKIICILFLIDFVPAARYIDGVRSSVHCLD